MYIYRIETSTFSYWFDSYHILDGESKETQ